jgi:hypothetical protein
MTNFNYELAGRQRYKFGAVFQEPDIDMDSNLLINLGQMPATKNPSKEMSTRIMALRDIKKDLRQRRNLSQSQISCTTMIGYA